MKKAMLSIGLCLTVAGAASAADTGSALQIVKSGKPGGATACASCHGVDGAGGGGGAFPRLAGQPKAYLENQLKAYRDDKRANVIMQPIAKNLSDQEMSALAGYYSRQSAPFEPVPTPDADVLRKGGKIVELGLWDKNIPACIACHGPGAKGVPPHFPSLAGQYPQYIESQFKAWKEGTRKEHGLQLMTNIAKKMSGDEIAAAAAYLASIGKNKDAGPASSPAAAPAKKGGDTTNSKGGAPGAR